MVQHCTFAGSFGQNPGVDVPPLAPQDAVVTQTPGVPLAIEQGPFNAALVKVAERRIREVKVNRDDEGNSIVE